MGYIRGGVFVIFIGIWVQAGFSAAAGNSDGNNPVITLTKAEIEEIRHFATKAYSPKKQPVYYGDNQGSYSHYVGRRMKPSIQFQPFTVTMKRPGGQQQQQQQSQKSTSEQQTSGAVSTYSYLPAFRTNNHIVPPAPFSFSASPSFSFGRPPQPPRNKFFLRPQQQQKQQPRQVFSFSHPPVFSKRPGPPPPGYFTTSSIPTVAPTSAFSFIPATNTLLVTNNNNIGNNGANSAAPTPAVQIHHQAQIQAIMAHQHLLNVKEAQSQANSPKPSPVSLQVEEVKTPSESKVNEVSNEIKATVKPQQQLQYQPQQYLQQIQAQPQLQLFPRPPTRAEQYYQKYLSPNEYTVQYGPAIPAILEDARFARVPLRFEHMTQLPYPPTYQVHPQPAPFNLGGIVYQNQNQRFPEYSFNQAANPNFLRYQSIIHGPNSVSTTAVVGGAKAVPTVVSTQVNSTPATSTAQKSQAQSVEGQNQNPVQVIGEVVFESARIPEEVAIGSSAGLSYGRNGPLTLTPQEQRNVFTAAADSSLVIAPLVYSQDLPSPISSTTTPLVVTTQEAQVPTSQQQESTSVKTSSSVSTSNSEEIATEKPKPIYNRGKVRGGGVRVEQGVTTTVTRVLADGKRVRLRKVKKANANKDATSSAEAA